MGRVYAVASGKGGVGKTATTAALGTTLAAAGAETAVVDADLGMANLGATLGVSDGGPTVHDVLAGDVGVASATRVGPDGLSILPGAADLDAFVRSDPDRLAAALDRLASTHDHVLVDVGAGLSRETVAVLRAAAETLLVATPTRDGLRDAARTREAAERVGGSVRGAVLNRTDTEPADAADRLGCRVLWTVPQDPAVARAGEAGVPLREHAPGCPADRAYCGLARTLAGVAVSPPTDAGPTPDVAGPTQAAADGPDGLLARLRALV